VANFMQDQFLIQILILLGLMLLVYFGFVAIKITKGSRKIGLFGATAKMIDSYMSSHQANLKEMESIVEHEVKKTDPQDK
jgi:hypothetical protein